MVASAIRRKSNREYEKLAKTKQEFVELETGISFNMLYNMDNGTMTDLITAMKKIQKASQSKIEPCDEYSQSDNNNLCELMAPYAYRPDMDEKQAPFVKQSLLQLSCERKTVLPENETDAMLPVEMPLVDEKVGYCGMCNRLNFTADQIKDRVTLVNANIETEEQHVVKKPKRKEGRVKKATRKQMFIWLAAESRIKNGCVKRLPDDAPDEPVINPLDCLLDPGEEPLSFEDIISDKDKQSDQELYSELKQFRKDLASQTAKKASREAAKQKKEYFSHFEKYGMKPPNVDDDKPKKVVKRTACEEKAYRAQCKANSINLNDNDLFY